ncbi:sarcoplasmic reticulum histidine-rich calcium-binding protein [Drosophila madeirensis]|uniref:Sarcoplasmic reticulum histidine-rich calcium-binding protein n=1 Tax=Drosophila madeirensis TaxID=30013 RepID=A0AAU9FRJ6_DROMD
MDWRPPSVQAAAMGLLLCWLLLPTAHAWSLPAPASARVSSVSVPIRAAAAAPVARRLNEVSPYLDLALCPIRAEPWTCARQQSARILDSWDGELHVQWQKLKVEADRQMNATIERRGYSFSELPLKEKPSTILKKIEIGTNYMKKYLAESMDGFLGREYEYLQTSKATPDESENDQSGEDEDEDDEADAETTADSSDTAEEADQEEEDAEDAEDAEKDDDGDADDEEDADDADDDNDDDNASDNNTAEREPEGGEEEADEDEAEPESENVNAPVASVFSAQPPAELQGDDVKNTVFSEDSASTGAEFIELVDGEETAAGAVKKPGGGGKRKKDKKKNKKRRKKGQKGQHGHGQDQGHTQPATLVVVQQAPEHHEEDSGHGHGSHSVSHGHGHGGGGGGSVEHDDASVGAVSKPNKRKHKKRVKGRRKRKGQHASGGAAVEHEQSDLSLGLGLLDDLTEANDELLGGGGKRKHRNPIRYGRSNGVTRGKKKKKKKALAKVMLVGTFLKAKIELLLKILGAHLQVKFFAIALIGLLINIARFWIDVKRGSPPSKVVYVEHAHHQHHYEDHGDDWSEPGSYWKRSLQTDPSVEDVDSSTDSYQIRGQHQHQPQPQQQQPQDSHYLAYRNQHQWQ